MRVIPRLSVCLILLPTVFAAHPNARPSARAQRVSPNQFVLFSVKKYEHGTQVEPVVIVRRGAFVKPPVTEADAPGGDFDALSKKFAADYLKAGRRLKIISGGGDAGTATVTKYIEPGCVGMYAEVSTETAAKLGGQVQALATDANEIGKQAPSRRAPTEAERAAALELARAAFTRAGVGPAALRKMEVVNLTAVDLDRDGKSELVGGFRVDRSTERAADANTLFVIFEPSGQGFRPALTWSHRGGEADYQERRLVDYVDLDGDGVAEVIVEGTYYESNDYFVYKKQRGGWRSVYQGGGGGC
jgi:hypothetical protein